jgi:uncharacterized membrane protein/sporulation protein YlmC with PRC-barrel domain
MKNIPLAAQVNCSDGPAGQSTSIIVNPATHQATYVVVEEKKYSRTKRLVPVDQIAESRPDSIRLRCTLAELAEMELFSVTDYRQVEIPRYSGVDYSLSPYQTPEILIIEEEQEFIPAGQQPVRQGTKVVATDGEVGQVDDLILDPATGVVTHFVLRKGHRWGQKDVIMPVSMVKSVEAETVYLSLDRETIQAMLAIPTKQRRAAADIELLILSLAQADQADAALQALKQAIKRKEISMLNAAVLVKTEDGKVSLKEVEDVGSKRGALFGAISGGLIGLLGGPVGAVIGAVAGAASGSVAARWLDMGFPDDYLKKVQASLQPGSSALLVLVEQEQVEKVAQALAKFEGELLRQGLTDEMVSQFTGQAEAQTPGDAAK